MVEHNQGVIKALKRYTDPDQEPHYAIMLNGEWGCGKTHFVEERWLKNLSETDNYSIVSVSLYGMSEIKELENSLVYNQLKISEEENGNKITRNSASESLGSKFVQAGKNIFDGLGENFLGVTLEDVGPIFAREWLNDDKDNKTKILILDDLERSDIEVKKIFGFISSHLENTGLRVVFISNDKEIIEGDYEKTKEKVIGETFKIETDIDSAIKFFLEEIKSFSELERTYIEDLIKKIQFNLKIKNLRIIRQTLLKLSYLIKIVKEQESYKKYLSKHIKECVGDQEEQYYLKRISYLFIIANMQKLQGDLEKEKIQSCFSVYFRYSMDIKSYNEIEKSSLQLPSYCDNYEPLKQDVKGEEFAIWEKYIWDGYIDETKISSLVEQDMEALISSNKEEEEEKTLLKLVRYWNYDKDEFYRLQSVLLKELKDGEYIDINALVLSYNLLMIFSEENILGETNILNEKDIEELFEKVIEKIKTKVPNEKERTYEYDMKEINDCIEGYGLDIISYKGYQVEIVKTEEKRKLVKHFLDKVKNVYKKLSEKLTNDELKIDIKDIANSILRKEERSDVDTLFYSLDERMFSGTDQLGKFSKVPALYWLGIEDLWSMLEKSSIRKQEEFCSILESRYTYNPVQKEKKKSYLVLKPELEIVKELITKYENKYEEAKKNRDNKIKKYRDINDDVKNIYDNFSTNLEEIKSRELI